MTSAVLITGADGFIGSHVTEVLVRAGHRVRALAYYDVDDRHGWLDHIADDVRGHFEIQSGDVRDSGMVLRLMGGCDSVLHLAALISIPYSYESPISYIQTNVEGTQNILEAARVLDVNRVVLTSTSEVYGTAQFVPITEDHPLSAQSPYAASKVGADQLGLSYHRSFGTPVVILRPFNTYGPRQSTRAVIPTVITQILRGHRALNLGSVHPTRDFTFVEDTAAAFLAALVAPQGIGEVINVGSGFEISVGEVVSRIASIVGIDVEIKTAEERVRPPLSEVERLFADASRAADTIRWSPTLGGLEGFSRGLQETVHWFSKPENLRLYPSQGYAR